MYKSLNIKGKEYKLEYTVRASLYEDCIETMINLFGSISGVMVEDDITKDLNESEKVDVRMSLMDALKKQMYSIPNTALTLFYAGLMEHHGTGRNGDRSVCSKEDAEDVIYDYFEEHVEDGTDTFADILSICIAQMQEDGFFRRVGLEKILSQNKEETPKPNRAARRAKAKDTKKQS